MQKKIHWYHFAQTLICLINNNSSVHMIQRTTFQAFYLVRPLDFCDRIHNQRFYRIQAQIKLLYILYNSTFSKYSIHVYLNSLALPYNDRGSLQYLLGSLSSQNTLKQSQIKKTQIQVLLFTTAVSYCYMPLASLLIFF